MTDSLRFELTDDRIERMLAERARPGAPAALVPAVMAAVADVAQSPTGWWRPLRDSRDTGPRRTWTLAAAAALATLGLAVAIVGSGIVRPPNQVVVPPATIAPSLSPVPSPNLSPAPSLDVRPSATPSAAPSSSPAVAIPPVAGGPLIVYKLRPSAVDLFTLDPVTGDRVALGNLQNRTGPAGQSIVWAPDRRSAIVFGDGDSVIARVNVASKSVRALRLGPAGYRHAVSPTGDLVATLDDQGDRLVVSVMDLDGEQVNRSAELPAGITPQLAILWAPDGSALYVGSCFPCGAKGDSETSQHLFRVPIDGSPVEDVLQMTGGYFGYMTWSPDGSTLLFAHPECGGPTCVGGIATARLADKVITNVTTDGGNSPAWSPDGRRIAFARDFGASDPGIYVMDADGSNLVRLTTANEGITTGDRDPIGPRTGRRSCSRAGRSTRAWATCTSCRRPAVCPGCWSRTPWQIGRQTDGPSSNPTRPWPAARDRARRLQRSRAVDRAVPVRGAFPGSGRRLDRPRAQRRRDARSDAHRNARWRSDVRLAARWHRSGEDDDRDDLQPRRRVGQHRPVRVAAGQRGQLLPHGDPAVRRWEEGRPDLEPAPRDGRRPGADDRRTASRGCGLGDGLVRGRPGRLDRRRDGYDRIDRRGRPVGQRAGHPEAARRLLLRAADVVARRPLVRGHDTHPDRDRHVGDPARVLDRGLLHGRPRRVGHSPADRAGRWRAHPRPAQRRRGDPDRRGPAAADPAARRDERVWHQGRPRVQRARLGARRPDRAALRVRVRSRLADSGGSVRRARTRCRPSTSRPE